MTRETTNRDVQELYPESDAATKRDLEGLAHSISEFRAAVFQIAARSTGSATEWGLEQARVRRRSAQRRVMLEWAVAAALCVAALAPAVGFYRNHAAAVRAEHQAQLLKQREADTALLDQVTNELSEAVPDSMQPLAETDADYVSYETTGKMEKTNGRN
ncbi:hypothetical protein H7849_19910 [Alloacidobacterium dinghuense]|uniref:Uncharacterized protein n=1 Tax=Alloacidobacterium dinghuense TaxID=2763107 RepID=A0A7G8BFK9_9BACT|nr:hypothetical protein [Alloacidobacterium dinghuense]QNI31329.1 hypothetical protein H7849_19910 [Alloacidobacterium dinghuense]